MSVETVIPGDEFAPKETPVPEPSTISLAVENMHCGGCLRSVETAVSAVPGVSHARANLTAKRLNARFDADMCSEQDIVLALERAGFKAAPMEGREDAAAADRDYLRRVAVAGFAAANVMLLSVSIWAGAGDMDAATREFFHRLSALIALPAIAYAGQPFFRSAFEALKGKRLNMDVPISIAVVLAAAMSIFQMLQGSDQVYFDAAITLLFFLLIGRWLDQRLRTRARGEAQNLVSLQGGFATLLASDGAQRNVLAHTLAAGDRVLVAAGERIPADGVVVSGGGELDQSLITGESDPVEAKEGAQVYAGTINLSHALTVRVTAADDMTLLAEIGRLMADAEQGRDSYRRLADRAATIYAPAVHIFGAATFAIWLALGSGWETALTYAIAVLIITCPCALALAVPAVQIAAASRLFRNGILLKAPDALERLAEADAVIFDKTGTLTLGRPVLRNADELSSAKLRAAARLAAASRHPYARAVVEAATQRLGPVSVAAGVEEVPGKGLRRNTAKGEQRLGSAAWCGKKTGGEAASLWFADSDRSKTALDVQDTLRPDAHAVVGSLIAGGMPVTLLSGDRTDAVRRVADDLAIADWRAETDPAEKIALVKERGTSHKVLMVGDGLNDAPALTEAHVSISPATAADVSQRSAGLVFQGDRLSAVTLAIDIARRARSMALQNFGIALCYNAVCVPLAMMGYVTPLIAAVAMSTSSILVTANALRLSAGKERTA